MQTLRVNSSIGIVDATASYATNDLNSSLDRWVVVRPVEMLDACMEGVRNHLTSSARSSLICTRRASTTRTTFDVEFLPTANGCTDVRIPYRRYVSMAKWLDNSILRVYSKSWDSEWMSDEYQTQKTLMIWVPSAVPSVTIAEQKYIYCAAEIATACSTLLHFNSSDVSASESSYCFHLILAMKWTENI